jgi:hypothetical protein
MLHISKIAFANALSAERRATLTSPAAAEAIALRLLDCFGRASVGNPDVWVDEVAAILMRYDETIVAEAFQPGIGLQSRSRYLPNWPEIREACEAVAAERARVERREQLARHRVLIDTPLGLLPESEVDPSVLRLAGPPLAEPELTPQQRRERACERWENEVRPELVSWRYAEPKAAPESPTDALKRLAAEIGRTLTDADIALLPKASPRG